MQNDLLSFGQLLIQRRGAVPGLWLELLSQTICQHFDSCSSQHFDSCSRIPPGKSPRCCLDAASSTPVRFTKGDPGRICSTQRIQTPVDGSATHQGPFTYSHESGVIRYCVKKISVSCFFHLSYYDAFFIFLFSLLGEKKFSILFPFFELLKTTISIKFQCKCGGFPKMWQQHNLSL